MRLVLIAVGLAAAFWVAWVVYTLLRVKRERSDVPIDHDIGQAERGILKVIRKRRELKKKRAEAARDMTRADDFLRDLGE